MFLCSEDNWQFFLKLHLEWRCEFLKEKWNPFAPDKAYKQLSTRYTQLASLSVWWLCAVCTHVGIDAIQGLVKAVGKPL